MSLRLAVALALLVAWSPAACGGLVGVPESGTGATAGDESRGRETLTGTVTAVTDGDTIKVLDAGRREQRVRLAGIDAPESGQAYGQASKRNLSDLVYGKEVMVSYTKLDSYGRVLGVLYRGGEDVNLAQVEAGCAWHYKEYAHEQAPEDRERYAEAERKARAAGRGLWAEPDPVKPSEYRRQGRSRPE